MRNKNLKFKRCAIYTRSSSIENSTQQRNNLVQFTNSQNNWLCLPTHYDDFGCSGRDLQRPGLVKLLADVKRGLIDHVVISSADRLSRSVFDFMSFGKLFEEYGVNLVCVEQYPRGYGK